MAGDARALLADRFFRDLHQNFLTLFEQVADERNGSGLAAAETASASATTVTSAASAVARATLPIAIITGTRALGSLSVTCRRGRSANFHAGIDGTIAAGFGVEHGLGFSLRFFQFQFFAVFFALSGSAFGRMSFARVGKGRVMNLSHNLASLAIQMTRTSLGLFLKLFVAFIRGSFVMNRVRLFLV